MKNKLSDWHVVSVMPPVVETINDQSRYQGWRPCIDWCAKHFGEQRYYLHNSRGGERWRFVGEGVFEFKDKKDLVLFLLRWAS